MSTGGLPYGWIRSSLVFLATFAVMAVMLGLYLSGTSSLSPQPSKKTIERLEPDRVSTLDPETSKKVELTQGVETTGGDRPVYISYHPDTGDVRFVIGALAWHPVADRDNEMAIQQPVIRFRTPAGQWVKVTAEVGLMQVSQGGDDLSPVGGSLEGNVVLEIDRLSEEERNVLPPEQRDAITPERLIRITLGKIEFNLEYTTLRSFGPFRLTSAEADIESTELNLRYNELEARIELLSVGPGGRMSLRGLEGILNVPMPGSTVVTATSPDPSSGVPVKPTATETTRVSRLGADGVPIIEPDEDRAQVGTVSDLYAATWEGDVAVEQRQVGEVVGGLSADWMKILFEFGTKQRQARAPTSPVDAPASAETTPAQSDLNLTWSGNLTVKWESAGSATDTDREQLQLFAGGKKVVLTDQTSRVLCGELHYDAQSRAAIIKRSAEAPVQFVWSGQSRVVAEEITFNGQGNQAVVRGPGLLTQTHDVDPFAMISAASQTVEGMHIRFQDRVLLTLDHTEAPSTDPAVGIGQEQYLKAAEILGQVELAQSDMLLKAERVFAEFDRPRSAGAMADHLRSIRAEHNVRMTQGADRFHCTTMNILLVPDESGVSRPRHVEAIGPVDAFQSGRKISAGGRITADLVNVIIPRPPFDRKKAEAIAIQRGKDPAALDWAAIEASYTKKQQFQAVLSTVRAYEDVAIADPVENLSIRATELECDFGPGQTLERARVLGSASSPAYAQTGEYALRGEVIDLDRARGDAVVPGPGRMTILSPDSTLAGLDAVDQVEITWTERMLFDDEPDLAVVSLEGNPRVVAKRARSSPQSASVASLDAVGDALTGRALGMVLLGTPQGAALSLLVQRTLNEHLDAPAGEGIFGIEPSSAITTEESVFDCQGKLELTFLPIATSVAKVELPTDWWIVAPLTQPLSPKKSAGLGSMPTFTKEPATLRTEAPTALTISEFDAQGSLVRTRNTIRVSRLLADLRSRTLGAEGAGTLLIEDYAAMAGATPTAPSSLIFSMGAGMDASQTLIQWNGSLASDLSSGRVFLRDSVRLQHVSGGEMHLVQANTVASGTGRRAELTCDTMTLEFSPGESPSQATQRPESFSAGEVRAFSAEGRVSFYFETTELHGERMRYERATETLEVVGTTNVDARIDSPRLRMPFHRAIWDLRTNDLRKLEGASGEAR